MSGLKKHNLLFIFVYAILFFAGIKPLFHGFPDIERFFAEWMDERLTLTIIMKLGTLNFEPTHYMHPPLYHYLTFIPIAMFFVIGKVVGLFHDKLDFIRFYFNNTQDFFLIGRSMSYIFYWSSAVIIFKIMRLFYNRAVAHITTLAYLLIPRFIFDFSTVRPEPLLFLNSSIFFYFFFKYYLNNENKKYLFLSAFFLGVLFATKFNGIYLGCLFIFLLINDMKKRAWVERGDRRRFIARWIWVGFCVFIGIFICHPFFIIKFSKYMHNLRTFNVEMKYCWGMASNSNHFKELISTLYLNIFGFLILLFGCLSMLRRDKRLFLYICSAVLLYEIYFGIYLRNCSPLRYLNPILPAALLIFGAGIDFVFFYRKRLALILVGFIAVASYNYFDIWKGLSFGPTHIQKSKKFIEENIPELTKICITSINFMPQLNLTEESYFYLLKNAPAKKGIGGRGLPYEGVDNEAAYDDTFKKIRLESMTKRPQYNIVKWDNNLQTEEGAARFLKENDIKYIISNGEWFIGQKKLEDVNIASLVKEFKPNNKRVYETVYGDISLLIYKVD